MMQLSSDNSLRPDVTADELTTLLVDVFNDDPAGTAAWYATFSNFYGLLRFTEFDLLGWRRAAIVQTFGLGVTAHRYTPAEIANQYGVGVEKVTDFLDPNKAGCYRSVLRVADQRWRRSPCWAMCFFL